MNSAKILVTLVMFNLMIGFLLSSTSSEDSMNTYYLNKIKSEHDSVVAGTDTLDDLQQAQSDFDIDNPPGDMWKMGETIKNSIKFSIAPETAGQPQNPFESMLYWGINILVHIIQALIVLLLFMILWSKKTN